jgi:hypothetical protein
MPDDVFYVLTLLHCIVYLFILKPKRHLYCSFILHTMPVHDLHGVSMIAQHQKKKKKAIFVICM